MSPKLGYIALMIASGTVSVAQSIDSEVRTVTVPLTS